MKNFIRIFINILIAITLIIVFDYCCFLNRCYKYSYVKTHNLPLFQKGRKCKEICDRKYYTYLQPFIVNILDNFKFRDSITDNNEAVLIFGCSFAYGYELNHEESLSYQLSKATGLSVFNRAILGTGLKEALFQSQILYILKNSFQINPNNFEDSYSECINNSDLDEISKKSFMHLFSDKNFQKILRDYYLPILQNKQVKYVFFVLINDHLRRMYSRMLDPTEGMFTMVDYKIKNGNFILKDNSYNGRYRILYLIDALKFPIRSYDEKYMNMVQYLNEIKRLNTLTFGNNLNFIILNYDDDDENIKIEEYLEKNNFNTVKITQLINGDINDNEYKLKQDNWHPTGKVWKEAAPELSKRFIIQNQKVD